MLVSEVRGENAFRRRPSQKPFDFDFPSLTPSKHEAVEDEVILKE